MPRTRPHPSILVLFSFMLAMLLAPASPVYAQGEIGDTYPGALNPSAGMQLLNRTNLDSTSGTLLVGPLGGYAYYVTNGSPGKIKKVRLSDSAIVKELILQPGQNLVGTGVLDPTGYGYFSTSTSPGIIVKVRLSDLVLTGSLMLSSGENNVRSSTIDTTRGYVYFGTGTNPGKIVRIRISDFSRQGAITLNEDESHIVNALMDSKAGYAYFGVGMPGIVVKIRLSDFTRVGSVTLGTSAVRYSCGVIDPGGGYAYFGEELIFSCAIVRVRLSDFSVAGTLQINLDTSFDGAAIDSPSGYAYFATDTIFNPKNSFPGEVLKIRLADFRHVGSFRPGNDETLHSPILESQTGLLYGVLRNAYFSFLTRRLATASLSYRNTLHAKKVTVSEPVTIKDVNFYVHEGGGHLRLAIYNDKSPRQLVWQSLEIDVPTSNTWIVTPAASRTLLPPRLEPGTYWFAWKTDSQNNLAGWGDSMAPIEFSLYSVYDIFPGTVDPAKAINTNTYWAIYATINGNAACDWVGYQ